MDLEVRNLTVKVEGKIIIDDLSLKLEAGRTYVLMGPNGSGKSTLAKVIMGDPDYQIGPKSKILFNNENIVNLSSDKRAQMGIFMSFQTPPTIEGVRLEQIMQFALENKQDVVSTHRKIQQYAQELQINHDLLNRPLNENASGGERKKLEVLQSVILDRSLNIFDEIDTGVDVDSLALISKFLSRHKANKTYFFITHYQRILEYNKPDQIILIKQGKIHKIGGADIISRIEVEGFESL